MDKKRKDVIRTTFVNLHRKGIRLHDLLQFASEERLERADKLGPCRASRLLQLSSRQLKELSEVLAIQYGQLQEWEQK